MGLWLASPGRPSLPGLRTAKWPQSRPAHSILWELTVSSHVPWGWGWSLGGSGQGQVDSDHPSGYLYHAFTLLPGTAELTPPDSEAVIECGGRGRQGACEWSGAPTGAQGEATGAGHLGTHPAMGVTVGREAWLDSVTELSPFWW